ncbi:pseudouridine synthase, RluA family [Fannyhessea vaginae PB189-T1-4]|uniref:Pseudouridine synthase n=1 Tax=Fannyhessea vaginae PB189-T1-4 TaxID=866774 RepID=A0ABN0AYV3_9ACTN|nr:RluA family pseudouridine synthase [Fannyhessea vaginae]EFL43683.1 pseudouridine synthase, RluA family [Fannyhessea vaginae PB189-T1-4]
MSQERQTFLVSPQFDRMRLDSFLAAQTDMPARSACAKYIERGCVEINNTEALSKAEHVRLGDRVSIVVETQQKPTVIMPNPQIPLDVRYEDEYLLVISKQKGLVCHPSSGHIDDTLANALVAHCGFDHLGKLQGDDRPGIVHRLDMDTTGLMVAAKDNETQEQLQDLIRLRDFDRRYLALVQGYVSPDEGTITTGIARSKKNRLKMCVSKDPLSRQAITTFKTLDRFEASAHDDGYSLLECHLYTGRTHQIRVHMRYTGHCLVGDPLYGKVGERINLHLKRQFLHSWHINFDHPITHEHIELFDTLPSDLYTALINLRPRSMGETSWGAILYNKLNIQ